MKSTPLYDPIELAEIEAALKRHPDVAAAVVVVREDTPGTKQRVAYVTPSFAGLALAAGEQIERWKTVFNANAVRSSQISSEPTFNVHGWMSSYTGNPIPGSEMRTWVSDRVSKIQRLKPSRVLEIGCGAGLLVFQVAPGCAEYWGTDLSPEAIRSTQSAADELGLKGVQLQCVAANDFTGIPSGYFDVVVLNSVVQYFPSTAYLLEVLAGAAACLRSGGTIFIGDVRNLSLLQTLHTSVALTRAPRETSLVEIRSRIARVLRNEEELLLDPRFFLHLASALPRLSGVRIELQRGVAWNELNKFRYDVLLRFDAPLETDQITSLQWEGETFESITDTVKARRDSAFRVKRIPNARVMSDLYTQKVLDDPQFQGSAMEVHRAIDKHPPGNAADPESFAALADREGYHASILSFDPQLAYFDVLFSRNLSEGVLGFVASSALCSSEHGQNSFASDPAVKRFYRRLVPILHEHLRQTLPDFNLPITIAPVAEIPRS